MSAYHRAATTRVAGTLRLSAWHIADVADETGEWPNAEGHHVVELDAHGVRVVVVVVIP